MSFSPLPKNLNVRGCLQSGEIALEDVRMLVRFVDPTPALQDLDAQRVEKGASKLGPPMRSEEGLPSLSIRAVYVPESYVDLLAVVRNRIRLDEDLWEIRAVRAIEDKGKSEDLLPRYVAVLVFKGTQLTKRMESGAEAVETYDALLQQAPITLEVDIGGFVRCPLTVKPQIVLDAG